MEKLMDITYNMSPLATEKNFMGRVTICLLAAQMPRYNPAGSFEASKGIL
jgi:hypothetical protein